MHYGYGISFAVSNLHNNAEGRLLMPDDEDKLVAEQIVHYLESHPDAADCLEGIAKWWIPQQQYIESVEKVYKALNYLIENEIVSQKILSDGSKIYVRNNGRLD